MATSSVESKRGIVLRLVPQKESDAMVTCLGQDGYFSFYARGARKSASSALSSTMEGSLSDFTLVISSGGSMTLKEGSMLQSYLVLDSYEASMAVSGLFEITLSLIMAEDAPKAYSRLLATLNAIHKGRDPYSMLFLYLCFALRLSGYGLDVDGCALCGSKTGIVTFSPEAGGYVCRECFDEASMPKLDPFALKMYRFAFRCGDQDIERVSFGKEHLLPAFSSLCEFAYDMTGVKLASISQILRY